MEGKGGAGKVGLATEQDTRLSLEGSALVDLQRRGYGKFY